MHHVLGVHQRPDLELAIDNVVVLCRSCHLRETLRGREQVSPERTAWRALVDELLTAAGGSSMLTGRRRGKSGTA